jgi:hypothetical protein
MGHTFTRVPYHCRYIGEVDGGTMTGATLERLRTYSPRQRLGLALVALSVVFYFALVAVPFLPLATEQQVILATAFAISTEGSFWLGCLVAGKEIIAFMRRKLWPF